MRTIYRPWTGETFQEIVFVQDKRSQSNELYVDGKLEKQWTGVTKPGEFERHCSVYGDGKIKLELDWDEDKDKEVLFLDGQKFEELPFLNDDFDLHD